MNTRMGIALAAALLLSTTGCAYNEFVGHTTSHSGSYYGNVGVTGNGNTLTIDADSRLTKLSIIGNDNTVTVEDGVTLPKIEFWGQNNVVNLPDEITPRCTEVGHNNRIVYRPAAWRTGAAPTEMSTRPPAQPVTP